MEEKTLQDCPHRLRELVSLIEEAFQYPSEQSFQVDFAPLLEPANWPHLHLLIDKKTDRIAAHIGLKPRQLNLGQGEKIPVALLGGIAVHAHYQGQGLFRQLMAAALEQEEHSFALFFLWGQHWDLYKKFCFFPQGQQVTMAPGPHPLPADFYETRLHNLSEGQAQQVRALFQQRCQNLITLERQDEHWRQLALIHSMRLFLRQRRGQVQGYFFLEKGADLTGVIHEAAGQVDDLKGGPFTLWQENRGQEEGHQEVLALIREGRHPQWPAHREKIRQALQNGTLYLFAADSI